MIKLCLTVALCLALPAVQAQFNYAEDDTAISEKQNSPFKPEVCDVKTHVDHRRISLESDIRINPTEGFWSRFKQKVMESVKEVLTKRCELCQKEKEEEREQGAPENKLIPVPAISDDTVKKAEQQPAMGFSRPKLPEQRASLGSLHTVADN